jgi:cellulose biosynthesis protein BcsQ
MFLGEEMIITFYSYKGGVGRSMALANAAALMGEDVEHPQKVLVWDFDLEAPGLHRLFPPRNPHESGFVDLVYQYAETGKLPNVSQYIYSSRITNVDVLPAGKIDDLYCKKLQEIDWTAFFDETSQGSIFNQLAEAINGLGYDYVLIDSRTGLNDQAGICTQVLPDMIVILFRLTFQNIDGLEHVVPMIKHQLNTRDKNDVEIIPVASSVVSSTSQHFHEIKNDARNLFGVDRLSYIRFDPDMLSDERIFSLADNRKKIWPNPAVNSDYAALVHSIRRKNSLDTQTVDKEVTLRLRNQDYAGASNLVIPLIKRRSNVPKIWSRFTDLYKRVPPNGNPEYEAAVNAILKSEPENIYALEWRALRALENIISNGIDDSNKERLVESLNIMDAILRKEERRAWIYYAKAVILNYGGEIDVAIQCLEKGIKANPTNAQLKADLAGYLIRKGSAYFALAIQNLEESYKQGAPQDGIVSLCYLNSYLGNETKANEWFEEFLKQTENVEHAESFQILVKGYMGLLGRKKAQVDEFIDYIKKRAKKAALSDFANWAEFLFCSGNTKLATELLSSKRSLRSVELKALRLLMDYLTKKSDSPNEKDVLAAWRIKSWNFKELIFVKAMRERGSHAGILVDRLSVLEKLNAQMDFVVELPRRMQLKINQRIGG